MPPPKRRPVDRQRAFEDIFQRPTATAAPRPGPVPGPGPGPGPGYAPGSQANFGAAYGPQPVYNEPYHAQYTPQPAGPRYLPQDPRIRPYYPVQQPQYPVSSPYILQQPASPNQRATDYIWQQQQQRLPNNSDYLPDQTESSSLHETSPHLSAYLVKPSQSDVFPEVDDSVSVNGDYSQIPEDNATWRSSDRESFHSDGFTQAGPGQHPHLRLT